MKATRLLIEPTYLLEPALRGSVVLEYGNGQKVTVELPAEEVASLLIQAGAAARAVLAQLQSQ